MSKHENDQTKRKKFKTAIKVGKILKICPFRTKNLSLGHNFSNSKLFSLYYIKL